MQGKCSEVTQTAEFDLDVYVLMVSFFRVVENLYFFNKILAKQFLLKHRKVHCRRMQQSKGKKSTGNNDEYYQATYATRHILKYCPYALEGSFEINGEDASE